jgi:hypothetical protein
MPTSLSNPYPLTPIDVPKTVGGLPASGPALTGFNGIRLNRPLSKLFMSGAVRRDVADISIGNGQSLVASTVYVNYALIQRASLITAIYLVAQTMPTVGATLAITYNAATLLSTSTVSVINSTYTAGQVYSLPLATTGALIDSKSGLPYLTPTNGANGFPYPILVSWTAAASGTQALNPAIFIEYEPDDFNG